MKYEKIRKEILSAFQEIKIEVVRIIFLDPEQEELQEKEAIMTF